MKKELQVLVLMGGPGEEHVISLESGNAVLSALLSQEIFASSLEIEGEDFALPDGVDLVFNLIHGVFGEDGTLQKILDEKGIKYTGTDAKSSRIAFDKKKSKKKFLEKEIPTPRVFLPSEISQSDFPIVVKPINQGSSLGISIVENMKEFSIALEEAYRYSSEILVEEYIVGKELTVSLLGKEIFPVVCVEPETGFYSKENKYPQIFGGSTEYFCPAPLSSNLTNRVQEMAFSAHRALGVSVYSRVDIILEQKTQIPYVLELNTLPGMTEKSLFPLAAKEANYSFEELCLRIIEISLEKES